MAVLGEIIGNKNFHLPFSFRLFSLKPIEPVWRVAALFSRVAAAPRQAPQPPVHLHLLLLLPAAPHLQHLHLLQPCPSSLLSKFSSIQLISIWLPPVAGLKHSSLSASERGACPSALTQPPSHPESSSSIVRISQWCHLKSGGCYSCLVSLMNYE